MVNSWLRIDYVFKSEMYFLNQSENNHQLQNFNPKAATPCKRDRLTYNCSKMFLYEVYLQMYLI